MASDEEPGQETSQQHLSSSSSSVPVVGHLRDVSDELTQFAPFEASRNMYPSSLPYRGEPLKPPQVEINEGGSYLGQPKVLFRKLKSSAGLGASSGSGGRGLSWGEVGPKRLSPRVSPDRGEYHHLQTGRRGGAAAVGGSDRGGAGSSGRRVRVQGVVTTGEEMERTGKRRERLLDSGSGQMTKSLVLNRIGTLGKEQDSKQELKKYWMPDSACKECSECGTKFNIIIRRHHCRICGRIFCNACCSLTIPARKLRPDLQGSLRVCKECLGIFQEFQSSKRPEGHSLSSELRSKHPKLLVPSSSSSGASSSPPSPSIISGRIRSVSSSLQKNVAVGSSPVIGDTGGGGAGGGGGVGVGGGGVRQSVSVTHKSWDDASSGRSQDDQPVGRSRLNVGFDNPALLQPKESFQSLHERDERIMALNEDEVEYVITEVWFQLINPHTGIAPQNHRYRLKTYPNTFSASAIVAWLLRAGHASSRSAAVMMGQALVDTKRLRVVSSPTDNLFKDEQNLFLDLGQAANMKTELVESRLDPDAPTWFQRLRESGDTEYDQINLDSPRLMRGRSSLVASLQPTITISSMAELTGVTIDPSSSSSSHPIRKEEYVIVNPEQTGSTRTESGSGGGGGDGGEGGSLLSPGGSGNELKLSLHCTDHSVSPGPATPPTSTTTIPPVPFDPASPNYNNSFTVVTDRDIMKAIPVGGLSSAASAAQDLESDNTKDVKSNEEARLVFEKESLFHFDSIMIQLIKYHGISLGWLKVTKPLVMEAARKVHTNVYPSDTMDVKAYVKVKKIPGGRRVDSMLVNGVVSTKNITHKKMKINIRNPSILLLKCAFEFQRKENQLSSFDTLQMQEEKYLKNLVARVKTFQPRVILVQKSVARIALEMFYSLDIVVAVNVKPSVMERVARSTQGDLLHSLDQLFFNVRLGTCGHFYLQDFVLPDGVKKTLMYFDDCDPRLGCTITLMGGSSRELKKVKKVTLFGVFVAYNSLLERSFLVDEFAWPASDSPDLRLLPSLKDYCASPTTPEWPLHSSVSYPVEGISPAELKEKLEALVPECGVVKEVEYSSSHSTPIMPTRSVASNLHRSNFDTNSPLSNIRSYSMTAVRLDTALTHLASSDQDTATLPHIASRSVDDVRPTTMRSELRLLPLPPPPAPETLSRLGESEFERVLSRRILSISPGVKFPIPYLQTMRGFSADIRNYLPSVTYWSYQFQATALKISQNNKKASSETPNPLEMGTTTKTPDSAKLREIELPTSPTQVGVSGERGPQVITRSYRSISEHPFTTSIFLLKANTNEMRAALADYRANSGMANPSREFFFPTAGRASDYRHQLMNIFNQYQQFGQSTDERRLEGRSGEEGLERGANELIVEEGGERSNERGGGGGGGGGGGVDDGLERSGEPREKKEEEEMAAKPRVRRRVRRHTTSSVVGSLSGKRESLVLSGGGLRVDGGGGRAKSHEPHQERKDEQKITHDRWRERRESTPLGHMGTLDDMDRDYSKLAGQLPEEEQQLLDIHGNVEKVHIPAIQLDHVSTFFPSYQQVDCMDPMNHQIISILFSSTCHDGQRHQLPCVPPCIIQMLYYGHNDISLGDFLKRYCFRPDYRCQTCGSEMTKHQRHIVHGSSSLHISVQQLDIPIPRSNDGIFTWLACKHCTLCTPYVKMADSSLLFSFAKFLELKFHCDQFVTRLHSKRRASGNDTSSSSSCQHSLHRHYLHYFSFRNKIACFQPAEITILEMRIPPIEVTINTPHSDYHHDFAKEIKHIEHMTEGVCYRIKQRLQSYNMEPVTSSVRDSIASSRGERDAFRGRIKFLKDKVVQVGFMDSGEEAMTREEREGEFAALQDGIAEIKRALTEFVTCWNIELESLDNKIRVFHNRKEAAVSRNSDRDSPFTPLATEVPSSRGTTPRLLPRPDQEDNLLLNTPISSPPTSFVDDNKVTGASLNREAGDVARVEDLTPESNTEVGEEVRASSSGGTRSTQDNSSRCPYDTDKAFSSDRLAISTSEDLSTFDSHISSNSLSMEEGVEGSNGGGGRGGSDGGGGRGGGEDSGSDRAGAVPTNETTVEKTVSHTMEPSNRKSTLGEMEDGCRSSNITPTVVISENELGDGGGSGLIGEDEYDVEEEEEEEGRGGGWWSQRGSPMMTPRGSESPLKRESTPDTDSKSYQNVKSLVLGSSTPKLHHHQPPPPPQQSVEDTQQPDGVGLFNRFRGTKDTEVREDPNRFYLVDTAEMSTNSPNLTQRNQESTQQPQSHHQGHHSMPSRSQKRPGNAPSTRKNGTSSTAPPTDSDGRNSRGVKEKERTVPVRPFQKLPPPFDLSEHHNMHKSLKIPIAIYEKEPTSLIAYALSSREYAQEYWALVERRPLSVQPPEKQVSSRPSSPKIPKKSMDPPPLVQLPPPTKTSALKQAYQELKKKGPLNAMNVFSGHSGTSSSDRPEPHEKPSNEPRRIETALSSKSSHSSSSTPSKSSNSSSSFPATDQSTVQEDGDGFRWNTTGEQPSTGSSSKAGHISLEFTAPDRTSSIFCKVYYAEEFHHLREITFPSGEDRFIRSLSRCVKFDAKGGKSRSTFCKVIDDRLIMKQIKTVEISSFEQIAPLYFEHINKALESKRPLVLAKILGVYTIGYRNTRTGNSKRLDVIVMENLLYGRKSSKVFDLKGSMRSRYIDPSKDSSNDVLLDENFLNHICYSPVYVYPHSKSVLMRAIDEDTKFLAENAIMDYSLLTCIDDVTGELVVGIIDYVRTFTLDKRLEMYIKKTAGRVLPTVVYPELYRKRFCEAIDRYFTIVPDKWTGLGADF